MTPGARVQAAIDVLDTWLSAKQGLDRVLTQWGRANRYAGSGDRHAIADLVYGAVRRMRSAGFVAQAQGIPDGRALMRGALVLSGQDPADFFTGAGHAPAALAPDEGSRPLSALNDAPAPVALDYPDWLAPHIALLPDGVMSMMQQRAPLDLRVNLLKSTWDEAAAALREDGIGVEAAGLCETALRVVENPRKVLRSRAYLDGLVEVQDAASQRVAMLAGAGAGETVLDYCAGAGGKTLALAARMEGTGRLLAYDAAPQRLAHLPERAARAGVVVETCTKADLDALGAPCDLVLVDAPCSGSGAWRRNPDAKWTLTPDQLETRMRQQADVLGAAAGHVRGGGRLAYATCSLFACENGERIRAFMEDDPNWEIIEEESVTPLDGGDGFYVAVLRKARC